MNLHYSKFFISLNIIHILHFCRQFVYVLWGFDMTLSENMYQHILEHSKDATIIIGFDGNFIYYSPQLAKILGKIDEDITNLFSYISH